jgi:superfamily II DNA or RNA helicase
MSVQNESRELIQNIGSKLIYDYDQILYSWATGVGKSRVALKAVKEATSISKKKWLLFCKEVAHIENWKQEVEKHGLTDWFNETFEDVLCYASAHKYRDTEYNLCLDECHALSEMREDHLSTIRADKIISLSATVPFEVKQRLNNLKPFYEFHISLQEAIDKGLLPEPEVFIVYEDLDDSNKIFSYKIKDKEYRVTAKGFYHY